LDIFKFYVEDLKARFSDEKKLIKAVLKDKAFMVELNTTYEQFQAVILEDSRTANVDLGNMKLSFNSLIEKAEVREKERHKDEQRKRKRLESSFKALLRQLAPPIDPTSKWDEVRNRIANDPAFNAIAEEAERKSVFDDYVQMLAEACAHHHGQPKKKKKSKKQKKKASKSGSSSPDSEGEVKEKEKKHHSGKRKKRSRAMEDDEQSIERPPEETLSPTPGRAPSDGEEGELITPKKKKKRRHRSRSSDHGSPVRHDSKKRKMDEPSYRRGEARKEEDSDMESGELSESVLEERRSQLLKELQSQSSP